MTVALNAPKLETRNETGAVVLPVATLTLAGDGALKLKSITCSVRAKSCVTDSGSSPTACTLNR